MNVRLDDLRVLLAVQRGGSFLAAGRALGLSTSTVARRIDALEATLGRPLVMRAAQGSTIEEDARDLLALAEQLERGLEALRRKDELAPSRNAGVVRVSIPEAMIAYVVEILAGVRRQYPEIVVELVSEIRVTDLARRESDLGLRSARSSSKELVEKKLGDVRLGLFAAQSYLDRRLPGGTLAASEYARHDFVGFEGAMKDTFPHRWLEAHGVVRFPFRSNSDIAILAAAQHGQGIMLTNELSARDAGLVPVRTNAELPSAPLYLVYHRALRRVPRVQIVARALESAARARLG